jgi:multidrug resistance efflux pump
MLRRLLPIALLLAGAAATAVLVSSRPKPQALEVQEKEWIVATMSAQPQRLSPTLTLYAQVESPRSATLRAAVNAEVVEVIAREGDDAKSGTLLVKLDPSDAQWQVALREADVAELRAELGSEELRVATDRAALQHEVTLAELAQKAVERAQRLSSRDLGSAAGLDEAKQDAARQAMSVDNRRFAIAGHQSRVAALNARLTRALALESVAHLDLQRTQISAPFDARIAAVSVAPGDRVRVGDALLEVFDSRSLELRAQIPGSYLASLRAGLAAGQPAPATAMVDGKMVHARLDRLGARIESGRAGADALFRVDSATASTLELGRTVQLSVALPSVDNVVPIPTEALYGSDQVYLLIDSRMHLIKVQRVGEVVQADGSHRLLVKSEQLDADAKIIVTQLPGAVDGLKVRVAQ